MGKLITRFYPQIYQSRVGKIAILTASIVASLLRRKPVKWAATAESA